VTVALTIGVCGAGSFAGSFIPLFQAHPAVSEVRLAEVVPERRQAQARRFGIKRAYASLEELCASDVDAVGIFTQRWMHGPQAVAALRAGKHVYSAVPAATTLEEMARLIQAVEESGLIYMMGETSFYYPAALYCRARFARGDFGRFVYGEGEYLHDMSHGFYEAYQYSGGEAWKRTASFPPMLYPSHSISMILSVTGARMTDVSCLGYVDDHPDGVFREGTSQWGNTFSNQTALFRTSDGGMARINEFRRVAASGVRLSLYGTKGSYEEQTEARVWNALDLSAPAEDLSPLLTCRPPQVPDDVLAAVPEALREDFFSGVSQVHPVERLPREFVGHPNGHQGSHQFLVVDFVEACLTGKTPPNNVWQAARYCVPGMIAHESAWRGGESMPIPDFGDPPAAARG
jgi:predicted dehydrogenase